MEKYFEVMTNYCLSIPLKQYINIENITLISVLVAIYFGVKNIELVRKTEESKQDEMLFNISIANLDIAIRTLESLNGKKNDSATWAAVAEQLSAFHNIAIKIKNKNLQRCYCGKLHSYMLRINRILDNIDSYKFYYGVENYINMSPTELINESYPTHINISPNALGCLTQFLVLFHGAKGNYMSDDNEILLILQPIYYGFKTDRDYTSDEIERMQQPFKNIYLFINEWSSGIKKLRNSK